LVFRVEEMQRYLTADEREQVWALHRKILQKKQHDKGA